MKIKQKQLGYFLKETRKRQQLTLKEVSTLCDITIGYLSRIENESSTPSLDLLKKLSITYQLNLDDLVEDESGIDHDPGLIRLDTLLKEPNRLTYNEEPLTLSDRQAVEKCLTLLTDLEGSTQKNVLLAILDTLIKPEGEAL